MLFDFFTHLETVEQDVNTALTILYGVILYTHKLRL